MKVIRMIKGQKAPTRNQCVVVGRIVPKRVKKVRKYVQKPLTHNLVKALTGLKGR